MTSNSIEVLPSAYLVAGVPLLGAVLVAWFWHGSGSLAREFGVRFRPIDLLWGLGIGMRARGDSEIRGHRDRDERRGLCQRVLAFMHVLHVPTTSAVAAVRRSTFVFGLVAATLALPAGRSGGAVVTFNALVVVPSPVA